MPKISHASRLADKHHRTIILRLVLDPRGEIVSGEIVDLDGKSIGRFAGWRGMTRALRAWLAVQKFASPKPKRLNRIKTLTTNSKG